MFDSQDDTQLWGFDPSRSEFWGVGGLGWLFPLWAIALAVAATGYYYRYRPQPDDPSGSHNRSRRTPPTSLAIPTVRTSKATATR